MRTHAHGPSPVRTALVALAASALLAGAGCAGASPGGARERATAAGGWSAPRVVNDDGLGVVQFDPSITVGPDGSVHAAWVDFRDGAGVFGLFHARRAASGGRWSPNARVSDLIGPVCRDDPGVAVDAAGGVHVVWSDYRNVHPDIFASSLAPGASDWSAPRVVNDDDTETIQWAPAIAAAPDGGVWVAWSDYRDGEGAIYAARREPDGRWAPSERVDDAPSGGQDRPAIAVAPGGHVFVAWHDRRDDLGDVSAARRAPDGGWSPAVRLNGSPEGRQASPAIAVGGAGEVVVAWYDEADGATIHAATLAPRAGLGGVVDYDDAWSPDARVSRPGPRHAERPAVAVGDGAPIAAWYESMGIDGTILASERLPDGSWADPARVDGAAGATAGRNPAAAVDTGGRAHLVWHGAGDDGQTEIFHAEREMEPLAPIELAGRVVHETGRTAPGCPADGFALQACDGTRTPLVPVGADAEAALDAALGRIARIDGAVPEAEAPIGACRAVRAIRATLDAGACGPDGPTPPPDTGTVAGRLSIGPLASPAGAIVEVAGRRATVGADGRYFVDGVAAGRHRLRASAACALVAETDVEVGAGGVARPPDARLRAGDVDGTCAIDLRDLVAAGARYGEAPLSDRPCADVNGDGTVDLFDLAAVSGALGSVCPAPWEAPAAAAAAAAAATTRDADTRRETGRSETRRSLSQPRETAWSEAGRSEIDQGEAGRSESQPREPGRTENGRTESRRRDGVRRVIVGRAAEAGAAADGAGHTGGRSGLEVEVPIVVTEAEGLVGFAFTLRFDPAGTRVEDAEPAEAGHQAAALGPLAPGALVAANTVDPAAGEVHVAVSGLPPARGRRTLATVRLVVEPAAGRRPRVTSMQLAGADGARLPAPLEVVGFVAAPAYHVWFPVAHSGARAAAGRRNLDADLDAEP